MKELSGIPLYRQFLPRFIALVLLIVALVASIVGFYKQQFLQTEYTANVKYPSVVAIQNYQQLLLDAQTTLQQLFDLESVEKIVDIHSTLEAQISAINLSAISAGQPSIDVQHFNNAEHANIGRLTATSVRNQELYKSAVDDLSLFNTLLLKIDNTAINALPEFKLFSYKSNVLLDQLSNLTMQSSVELIDEISKQANALVTDFENMRVTLQSTPNFQELETTIYRFESTLFSEQSAIGKWRGALRLYINYKNNIAAYQPKITSLLGTTSAYFSQLTDKAVPQMTLFANYLSAEQITYAILSIIGILFITIFSLFVSLYNAIKNSSQHTVNVVKTLIKNESEHVNIDSQELADVVSTIKSIQRPTYSDDDYYALQHEMEHDLSVIAQLNRTSLWCIADGAVKFNNLAHIKEIAVLNSSESLQWRHIFNVVDNKKIIATARLAKAQNSTQTILLETRSKVPLQLVIAYQNNQWFGTIANAEQIAELTTFIRNNEQKSLHEKQYQVVATNNQQNKLSNMLVQAMLQSQNAAVVSGVPTPPVYRQLVRMFDWLRQLQVRTSIETSEQALTIADVCLMDEIHSAVFNAISESQLQQNKVLLNIDPHLLTHAKIDVRLFQRLFIGLTRLVLADQFKSQLKLSIKPLEQNDGRQIIKITAHVTTSQRITKLPNVLAQLISTSNKQQLSEIVLYFKALLTIQHGENLAAVLTEKGYQVSFEMPIAAPSQLEKSQVAVDFKQTTFLLLSANKDLQAIIEKAIKQSSGKIESLAKVDLFPQQYSIQDVIRTKLAMIIVGDDNMHKLPKIKQHIDSMPLSKQPKLCVMQSTTNAALAKEGLYSMSSSPICREQFIGDVAKLLKSDNANNLVIPASQLNSFNFNPVQVEVLFAVHSLSKHQMVWRLLNWLGFQVTVVSQPQTMLKHWQSGRYLVLINEFDELPFIDLAIGKSISRGVFTFNDDELIELSEAQADIAKHWHFGAMPQASDIAGLVSILSPWLKEVVTAPKKEKQRVKTDATVKTNEQKSDTDEEGIFNSQLIEQLPKAFNLTKYAENQGSPELAVYMLDDYTSALESLMVSIAHQLSERDNDGLLQSINQLKLTASILAATGLQQIILQLEQALLNNAFDNMLRLVEQAKQEVEAIKVYADAI